MEVIYQGGMAIEIHGNDIISCNTGKTQVIYGKDYTLLYACDLNFSDTSQVFDIIFVDSC